MTDFTEAKAKRRAALKLLRKYGKLETWTEKWPCVTVKMSSRAK